jgi:hypothetical protein
MSADPIIQDPYDSQSFNRYTYVWNNPLNATDPTGFQKCPTTGSHIERDCPEAASAPDRAQNGVADNGQTHGQTAGQSKAEAPTNSAGGGPQLLAQTLEKNAAEKQQEGKPQGDGDQSKSTIAPNGVRMNGSEAKLAQLLMQAGEKVRADILQAAKEAYLRDDFKTGSALLTLWHTIENAKSTLGADPAVATTSTTLTAVLGTRQFTVKEVAINFDVMNALSVYQNGAKAVTAAGYHVDFPSGIDGLAYLIVHEGRHGMVENTFPTPGGPRLGQRSRESDADDWVKRVYP